MQKLYTLELTGGELGMLLELVKHEQNYYADSEDETDVAVYKQQGSIIEKIYAAS